MALDSRLQLDDRTEVLLGPVADVIRRGLDRLPPRPPLAIRLGEPTRGSVDGAGYWSLDGPRVLLSPRLEGPAIHHPDEAQGPFPPLDRWRRAAASVLEAASLLALADQVQAAPASDWRWIGAAVHAADKVAPELDLASPDVAIAIRTGDPGRHPRAGVAVLRAWAAKEIDPIGRIRYLLTDGILSTTEWLDLGRWVLASDGAGKALAVQVERPAERDLPVDLGAWSWAPLRIPAHARGGIVDVAGPACVGDPWVAADHVHRTLAGATEQPARLTGGPGGPVGSWAVASAEGFGQVMGARGVSFVFERAGVARVVLADAFVGPLAAVAMAEQVGTSGVAEGRWKVGGRQLLNFVGLSGRDLTMHGRARDRFLMPARGFGIAEWLGALCDGPWAWEQGGDRLVMRGAMMGGAVEVRLRREAPTTGA